MSETRKKALKLEVVKKSDELGILWGYASVADLVDRQGDVVSQDELVQAVYQFMEDYYSEQASIKENHRQPADLVLVESTFHFLGCRLRWYVGLKLLSEELRQAARDGDISGFSIAGNFVAEEQIDAA
jgi:hypothetical protein